MEQRARLRGEKDDADDAEVLGGGGRGKNATKPLLNMIRRQAMSYWRCGFKSLLFAGARYDLEKPADGSQGNGRK